MDINMIIFINLNKTKRLKSQIVVMKFSSIDSTV